MKGKQSFEICPETLHPNLKVSQEDFNLLKIIGKGGYGTVYLVQKISPPKQNEFFAMKVLKKARIICNEKGADHTVSERNILKMLKHPFLVKLHFAFQNLLNLYIVLEYCPGGELFGYLEKQFFLSEPNACFYTSEITLAIGHLHSLGIIYRDLKLENILLDKDGHVKLTDFGLSKEGVRLTNTFCGTIEYMAPEIIQCQGHGVEVDWWSLGTLLYDMLSGGPPFVIENSRTETANNILYAEIKFPDTFSLEVVDFLRNLLNRDPKKRLGSKNDVEEIKAHPFFCVNNINWEDVFNRRLIPPFRPVLKSPTDVSFFDENFTNLNPALTPSDNNSIVPTDIFSGFSYVGNSVRDGFINEENFSSSLRFKRSQMIRNTRSKQSDSTNEQNAIAFKTKHSKGPLIGSMHNKTEKKATQQKGINRVSKMDNFRHASMNISIGSSKRSQTIEEAEEVVDSMNAEDDGSSHRSDSPQITFSAHVNNGGGTLPHKKKSTHHMPNTVNSSRPIAITTTNNNDIAASHSSLNHLQSERNQSNNCSIS